MTTLPDTGRTSRGKSNFVSFTYKDERQYAKPMPVFWFTKIRAVRIWQLPDSTTVKVSLDSIPTATEAKHLELAKTIEAAFRKQVLKNGGSLPEASYDPVNLDGAELLVSSDGKLKANEIPGFKPSVAIPFVRGSDMRTVPDRKPVVFAGTLRREDVAAIVAKSKHRKSFKASQSAICFAGKVPFLGMQPGEGRVLVVDAELHPEDTIARLHKQAKALGLRWKDLEDNLDVISLRGIQIDIHRLRDYLLTDLADELYAYMIFDNLYRMLPAGVNENDASGITSVMNVVAEIASEKNAAIQIVAHAPKGDMKNRAIEDLTSGTGAFGRYVDAQWGLYPHQEAGCMVLKTMLRADKTPPDTVIRFDDEKLIFVPEPNLSPHALAASGSRPDLRVDDVLKHLSKSFISKSAFITEMRAKLGTSEKLVKHLIEAGINDNKIIVKSARGPHPAQIKLQRTRQAAA